MCRPMEDTFWRPQAPRAVNLRGPLQSAITPRPALGAVGPPHPAWVCRHWGGSKARRRSVLYSLLCAVTSLLHDGLGALICV